MLTAESILEIIITVTVSMLAGFFIGMAIGSTIEPLTTEQEYNKLYSTCISSSFVNGRDLKQCNEIRMPSTIKEEQTIQ